MRMSPLPQGNPRPLTMLQAARATGSYLHSGCLVLLGIYKQVPSLEALGARLIRKVGHRFQHRLSQTRHGPQSVPR